MNESQLEETLWEIGEPVDLEIFVSGNQAEIKNFKVPEERQGTGEKLGPTVMEEIIETAQKNGVKTLVAHIDWTHRDANGYPADKNPRNDPTIKFLKRFDFNIDGYRTNQTIRAKLDIGSD